MAGRVFDERALREYLRAREFVATHRELRQLGVPASTITYRIRRSGPWQWGLPGVVIAHTGTPTRRERLLAGLAYAGPTAMITGVPGLNLRRIKAANRPGLEIPHLLVAHKVRRTSHFFVTIERCRSLPEPIVIDGLPVAPFPKLVADAARRQRDLDAVREIVSEVVQNGKCSAEDLIAVIADLARQRSAHLREAVAEVDAGVRSVAEAKARAIALRAGLPPLLFNPRLFTMGGDFIASPDGYMPSVAAGYEVDSFAYHLGRGSYLRTQRRQRSVTRHGVLLIAVSPVDVLADPPSFQADLHGLARTASARRLPEIVVRPADSSAA